MKATAILGAIICAALGGAIWGVATSRLGYEVGYVACGIGLIVGLAAAMLGARGTAAGLVCGVLALLAIAGGKLLAIDLDIRNVDPAKIRQEVAGDFPRELYD